MYEALVNKDVSYEGIFIAAVKTTGVFCRPTCTARKPNKENVEFFQNNKRSLYFMVTDLVKFVTVRNVRRNT